MCLSLIEPSLAKVGVELIDPDIPTLKCKTCGKLWTPILISGGLLPKNWWRCPINPEHTRPIKPLEQTRVVISSEMTPG